MKHIESVLIVDGDRGIYAPQQFVKIMGMDTNDDEFIHHCDFDDITNVLNGPDNEDYWDSWDSITQDFEDPDGNVILEHDGDIFLIHPDHMPED